MIATLQMTLNSSDSQELNYNMASLLHGVIIEQLDSEYADILHNASLKPFSQYIIKDKKTGRFQWTINTLNEEAYEKIIGPLARDSFRSFRLRHKQVNINILNKEWSFIPYGELLQKHYIQKIPSRIIKLEFLTPTAFKSFGEYIFLPDMKLIYKNLLNKYNNFSSGYSIKSDHLVEDLVERTAMIDYKLRSTRFHLEGVRIPSFTGEVTVKINGPEAMLNLTNLLFSYANWSGIGIKTALGMGGIFNKN